MKAFWSSSIKIYSMSDIWIDYAYKKTIKFARVWVIVEFQNR